MQKIKDPILLIGVFLPSNDLLSQDPAVQVPSALRELNFRVRDGNGCDLSRHYHQTDLFGFSGCVP